MNRWLLAAVAVAVTAFPGCAGESRGPDGLPPEPAAGSPADPYAALVDALHSGQPPLESLAMETYLDTGAAIPGSAHPPPLADVQPLADTADPRVRVMAVALLGSTRRPDLLPLLRRKLTDVDPSVRLAAAYGLAMAGDTSEATALRDGLGSPDVTARRTAAWLLGLMGNPTAVGLLKVKLDDPDAVVVLRAAEAMGRLGSQGGLEQVRVLTEHERHQVRFYATRLLGRLGTTADVPRLDKLCQSQFLDVKFAAIAAAARQGDLVRIGLLLEMLGAPDEPTRVLAARELGETAYTPAIPRLEKRLAVGDPMERTTAASSIVRIRAAPSWRAKILADKPPPAPAPPPAPKP